MLSASKSLRLPKMLEDLLTTKEVAEILKVTQVTLRKWRSAETGPSYFCIGEGSRPRVRYRRQDIEEWIKSCRITLGDDA